MRFRFIRTGDNPTDQADYELLIRDCFSACTDEVKTRLDRFIKSEEESVTFEFDGQTVTIQREPRF